jgi:transcriptional regulator with XRE-family HTH domain
VDDLGALGDLLWQWRQRRGLSLGQLAQAAGVSKPAVSRWEAGDRLPCVPELEATLAALDVSAAESALAFACIPAPRALRHLKRDLAPATGSPLTKGDLLRALRLRKGWTQARLAHQVGVSRQSVARWERLERLPSDEQIQALCYALGARETEVIALTTDRFADPPDNEPGTWEEAAEAIESLLYGLLYGPFNHVADVLRFYLLDEKLWRWSLRQKEARHWLLRLRIYHAHEHRRHLRWELVDEMLKKAQEAVPDEQMGLELRLRHLILSARLAVHGGHHPSPARGMHLLLPFVEVSRALPEFHAWILADLAKYAALGHAFDGAVSRAEQACAAAERHDRWMELWLRRCDYGTLLVRAGRAVEALAVLPDPDASVWNGVPLDPISCDAYVQAYLSWVEAHAAVGHRSEAQRALSKAQAMLETVGIPEERQRASALAARIEAG